MRIIRIAMKLPPAIGGMENHIRHLSDLQINQGLKLKILFNYGNINSINYTQITKLPLYRIKPQFFGVSIFYLLSIFFIFKNRLKADIIHIHGDWSSFLYIPVLTRILGAKKVVATIHDDISENIIYRYLLGRLLQKIDVIFSTGFKTKVDIESITKREVYFQPSGIDDVFYGNNLDYAKLNPTINILTVSRLDKKKRIEMILQIAKERPSYQFIIIGEGKERKKLIHIANSEKITNINFLGEMTQKKLVKYYSNADIFLFTSKKEGTPGVLMEAMACGLPLVSSNAGMVSEFLKGDNIFLSVDKGFRDYLPFIDRLANNRILREKISLQNIEYAKRFKWLNVATKINSVFTN